MHIDFSVNGGPLFYLNSRAFEISADRAAFSQENHIRCRQISYDRAQHFDPFRENVCLNSAGRANPHNRSAETRFTLKFRVDGQVRAFQKASPRHRLRDEYD